VAEWLGRALQKLLQQFESARDLNTKGSQYCDPFVLNSALSFSRVPGNYFHMRYGKPTRRIAWFYIIEVAGLIRELKETGTISILDELIQLTPSGLFDMIRIKDLGGKKLSLLWKAGIDNPESLLEVCKKHQVNNIPGFGLKTEQNILANIETLNSAQSRFHYGFVAGQAIQLVAQL
jgi:hypothetical protein